MKVCRLCPENGPQPLSSFGKSRKSKDGFDGRCKKCRSRTYFDNLENNKKAARENYWKNALRRRKKALERYELDRSSILERRREKWNSNSDLRERYKSYRSDRRHRCFTALGGRCADCGISDMDVLTIDHVANDGSGERNLSNLKIWNKVIRGEERGRYQALCFNCNLKKGFLREASPPSGRVKSCPTCLGSLDTSLFYRDRKYADGLYYECRSCVQQRDRIVKQMAFLSLGTDRCFSCGEEDLDMLTIDHVDGDGKKLRHSEGFGINFYRKVRDGSLDRKNYQVLCLNCNVKKHLTGVPRRFSSESLVYPASSPPHDLINFSFSDVCVLRTENVRECVRFLEKNHYSGYGRHGKALYGVSVDGEIIACMKIASPVRKEVATSMRLGYQEVLELDRFCIHPNRHKKNFGSFLLSSLVRLVRSDFPSCSLLVSFADPSRGHDGTIYRASNWKAVGTTTRSYEYVDRNGLIHHKKTVYDAARSRDMLEREYAGLNGLIRRYTVRKIKFCYDLRR